MTVPISLSSVTSTINQIVDPLNSIRASTIEQCYFISPSPLTFICQYHVGIKPSNKYNRNFRIQNKTLSHDIKIDIVCPSFLSSTLGLQFIIPKTQTVSTTIYINEEVCKDLIFQNKTTLSEPLTFRVSILNVNSPVYIYN